MSFAKTVLVFSNLLAFAIFAQATNDTSTTTLAPLPAKNETNYCQVKACSNPENHVYCKYPEDKYAKKCSSYDDIVIELVTLDESDKVKLISTHNRIRIEKSNERFPSSYLQWDEDLEKLAQRWAKQCPQDAQTDQCRSLDKFEGMVFQNVYAEQHRGTFILNQNINLTNIIQVGTDQSMGLEQVVELWNTRNRQHPALSPISRPANRIGCAVVKRRVPAVQELVHRAYSKAKQYSLVTINHVVCNYGALYN